jgi:glyoxylate/hydroxypyruvate reductase
MEKINFGKWRPKVLIAHKGLPSASLKCLHEKCDLIFAKSNNRLEILQQVKGVDGILWASVQKLNAEVLDAAGPQLKSISIKSAGYEFLDVAEIRKRNISLGYTPTLPASAVSEHALGLALSAGRRYYDGRLCIEEDKWPDEPQTFLGMEIRDAVIGIVGFGEIGQAIAQKLKSFEPREIIYSGRNEKKEKGSALGANYVSFEQLIERSDFVFISCALTNETKNLFNSQVFEKMKRKSVLINVARGGVVDHAALYDALKNYTIFAAGLDVVATEPLPINDPLLSLRNCGMLTSFQNHFLFKLKRFSLVVTPHIGTSTFRTANEMAELAAMNVLLGLADQPMLTPIPL